MKSSFTKIICAMLCVAAIGGGIFSFINTNKKAISEELTIIENVEALSQSETNPCTNTNGYRQWSETGGLFKTPKFFYDCCYKLREGYSPKHSCLN